MNIHFTSLDTPWWRLGVTVGCAWPVKEAGLQKVNVAFNTTEWCYLIGKRSYKPRTWQGTFQQSQPDASLGSEEVKSRVYMNHIKSQQWEERYSSFLLLLLFWRHTWTRQVLIFLSYFSPLSLLPLSLFCSFNCRYKNGQMLPFDGEGHSLHLSNVCAALE